MHVLIHWLTVALIAFVPVSPALALDCPTMLLHVGSDGAVIAGTKPGLVDHIGGGGRVQIGWQVGQPPDHLVHWAEPMFTTVFHEDVHAQLAPIHVQRGRRSTRAVELFGEQAQRWYGLIATTGQLSGRIGETGVIEAVSVKQVWCAVPD